MRSSFRRDVKWVRPTHDLSLEIFFEGVRRVRAGAGDAALVVLPSTEYFNTFLLRHRRKIEEMDCRIPLVQASLYARLTEKRSAADFFSTAGLALPRDVPASATCDPPIVAKPFRNVSVAGESLYPHLLQTRAEIRTFFATHDAKDYFFQEYVRGDSLYLLFHLSQTGRHEFTWSQRNLLQQPDGKSMLLAESSDFHGSETAARIMRALRDAGFHGLGMVEVIRTADRDVFIEMNPRIWGPVQFCLDQQQPLLPAFIGEALHDDPLRFADRQPRRCRRRYFWLGGLLETLRSGRRPTWHAARRALFPVILGSLASDVYLRKDSWRCFLHDLFRASKDYQRGERTQG
ncbi:MAG TPA: hypothetical protein VGK80_01320 [Rhodanobacteraceae bacterium]